MPPFYFNVVEGNGERIIDEEGKEYKDVESAKADAEQAARELVGEALKFDQEIDGRKIEVVDEAGNVVATIKLRDLVKRTAS